jgi:phosphoglycolate phosphatase-like HAD superfamily hydrolase
MLVGVAERMRLSLLTGNLRPIAVMKVKLIGLARYFDLSAGAFGTDAEDRLELVPIARSRAGAPATPWPRARTALVGDTPADIATALADGVRSLLFSSSRFRKEHLHGADAVVSHASSMVETLRGWHAAPD